ncbi:putative MFS family arabinose efflux permease [Ureibacillus chungkukjangi]|uniref:Putative MFS family arabinose efflux permease n=2 Tax=Ureibacillus chungkukjangi TaxID=1202712 RepID=A0A318TP32_9BACL|nr:MFS transporter [Ureibacillus chungkukjangi]PYF06394.1 putative MFS family arabinose efflux permease [Ureibacillus chungkukjangi]HCG4536292.1 MFS transporter [Salmonella enterica subsp. enterica serovar Typhi str. AG3]
MIEKTVIEKERLWTRNFIMISLTNFLVTLIFYLLIVVIAGYAVDEFDASTSTAGLVSSIFIVGSLVGRLITGRVITSIGSKRTFQIGLIAFLITTFAYFIAVNLPVLILIRLLHGVAVGIIGTTTGTLIAQIIPPSRRGEGIGYFSMSAVLATAIGPFIGILLTQNTESFTSIFIFNAILVVVCVLMYFTVNLNNIKAPIIQKEATSEKGFKLSNYIEPKALPISIIVLFIGFAYSGVMSFLSFYSESIDLVKAGSYFFLVYAITILCTRPITGPLMDRKGANIVVYPALGIFAVGMLLFSQATNSFLFLVAAGLIGIGYGNMNSIAQALAVKSTEPHRYGLATSTYFILLDIGLGVGPFVLGLIEPHTTYRILFLAMVPVILIALVLYYFLVHKKNH